MFASTNPKLSIKDMEEKNRSVKTHIIKIQSLNKSGVKGLPCANHHSPARDSDASSWIYDPCKHQEEGSWRQQHPSSSSSYQRRKEKQKTMEVRR